MGWPGVGVAKNLQTAFRSALRAKLIPSGTASAGATSTTCPSGEDNTTVSPAAATEKLVCSRPVTGVRSFPEAKTTNRAPAASVRSGNTHLNGSASRSLNPQPASNTGESPAL